MKYQIIIAIIAVVLIVVGIIFLERDLLINQQTNVSRVVFPTQDQITSTLGTGWNVTGILEENFSNAVYSQYPGAIALYQEYVQNGNQTISLTVLLLNSTSNIQGIKVGKYLITANITGNSTPINLKNIENLELSSLRSGKGLSPTLNPLLIPAKENITLLEFGNATTKNYTLYFESIEYNKTFTYIDLAVSSNISNLFNQLLSSAGKNVTISTINGAKYFNISFTSFYGSVYYTVGIKDNYLVFIQSQTPQSFMFFTYIINELP